MKNILFIIIGLIIPCISTAKLTNETELGMTLTGGATKSTSFKMAEKLSLNNATLKGFVRKGKSNGIVFIDNWKGEFGYQRNFDDAASWFVSQSIESNPILGLDKRYSSDIGIKWSASDKFIFELGYRLDFEKPVNTQVTNREMIIRAKAQTTQAIPPNIVASAFLEMLPLANNLSDYRANLGISVINSVNKNLGFKLSFESQYDKTPLVSSKWDRVFTTSIVVSI